MTTDLGSKYPRVLVISNDSFSKSGANGRTVGSLFLSWPKNSVYSFFINDKHNDLLDCGSFQITDREALKSVLQFRKIKNVFSSQKRVTLEDGKTKRNIKKTAFSLILRNALWHLAFLHLRNYFDWVHQIKPEIIFLFEGDSPFLFGLAVKTATISNAKLFIYSTEDYYFKKWDYTKGHFGFSLFYPIFHKKLKRSTAKAINYASYCLYNSPYLALAFQKEFPKSKEDVLFASTNWMPVGPEKASATFNVAYFGNIGVGRAKSLLDVGNCLSKIGVPFKFDIYTNSDSEDDLSVLKQNGNILINRAVSYDSLPQIVNNANLIVHAEGFGPYFENDTVHAFSTKIADCLASGRCFLAYGPIGASEIQYLNDTDSAFVATDVSELMLLLEQIAKNPSIRSKHYEASQKAVRDNHSLATNQEKLRTLFLQSLNEKR